MVLPSEFRNSALRSTPKNKDQVRIKAKGLKCELAKFHINPLFFPVIKVGMGICMRGPTVEEKKICSSINVLFAPTHYSQPFTLYDEKRTP